MLTWFLIFLLVIGISAYFRLSLILWTAILGSTLFLFSFSHLSSVGGLLILWIIYMAVVIPLNLSDFRKNKISLPIKT